MGTVPKQCVSRVAVHPVQSTPPRYRFPPCRDPLDEPAIFDTLAPLERDELLVWIRVVLRHGRAGRDRTAYSLKHDFQWNTGVYVYTGAFKGAMLHCGFAPIDPHVANWSFNIARVSDRTRRTIYGEWRVPTPWWLRDPR